MEFKIQYIYMNLEPWFKWSKSQKTRRKIHDSKQVVCVCVDNSKKKKKTGVFIHHGQRKKIDVLLHVDRDILCCFFLLFNFYFKPSK